MATPITWRNVDAPDNRGVSGMLGAAQEGINSGLGQIAGVLKQRESINDANWNQQKTNNTQAFLDELGKFRTPEEYQAALASGQLDQMRQGYGAQVDVAATRAAEEARLGNLQQRVKQGIEYQNVTQDAKDAPVLQRLTATAMQDPIAAAAEAADADLSAKGRLAFQESMRKITGDTVAQERATTKFGFDVNDEARKAADQRMQEALAPLQREQMIAATEHSNVATEELRGTEALKERKTESEKASKARLAARSRVVEGGVFNLGSLDSKEGSKAIDDRLTSKLVDPSDVGRIQGELGVLARQGVTGRDGQPIPVPAAYVLEAIRGMGESGMTGRWGNQVSDAVRKRVLENQDKILADHNAIVTFDNAEIRAGLTPSDTVLPEKKDSPTAPITKAAVTAGVTPAPVVKQEAKAVDPQAEARKALKEAFTTTQNDIRKAGGIDNASQTQLDELRRIRTATTALDSQEATTRETLAKQLSAQRRIADQEDARKKALGR